MRALIVSDVHANQEALEAVLEDAQRRGGFDAIWSLGDMVGYGPDPAACLRLLRQHPLIVIMGNHDAAAVGLLDVALFNHEAAYAARWTAAQLPPEDTKYLAELPRATVAEPFTLVHGSLRDPLLEYLVNAGAAMGTFELMTTPHCLVGHSHIPFICREQPGRLPSFTQFTEERPFPLGAERWIVNPGSVGQPRDNDPRASYAIYDDQASALTHYRVAYPIAQTQAKMRKAGLPQSLADRLAYGI